MNGSDLSSLTYKQLQALAVRYRVPGNIKKHQLVRVLQAVQNGNGTEVDQLLAELQRTRKKRMKKVKRDKMSVISTPIHSPNYAMSEDYYYPQQPPYQWVGAEEEISSREEDPARFPTYDEFQQLLVQKIQRQYQSYTRQSTEQNSTVVDLRMGAGSSTVCLMSEVNRAKANSIVNPTGYDQPLLCEGELQNAQDTNRNNQVPIILKKMLEAPAGANLGQIASPDATSCKISSLEQMPNNSSDPLDDSETLTAESCGENDDYWDYGNNPGNNNHSYYFVVNNIKEPPNINQAQTQDKTVQDIGQLPINFLTNIANQYQSTDSVSDVQANCQKWIATNSFVNKDANYAENHQPENSRSYNPVDYENASGNSRLTKARNHEQNYQNNCPNENINDEGNRWSVQGQPIIEAYHCYQINNDNTGTPVNLNGAFYSQQVAERVGDATQKYFSQGSGNNLHTSIGDNDGRAAAQGTPAAQFVGNSYNRETIAVFNAPESNGIQYNLGYYSQYPNENNQSVVGYPNADQQQYQYQQQQQEQLQQYQQNQLHQYQYQQTNAAAGQEPADRKNFEESATSQSVTNGPLNFFWPRWPINSTVTSSGQLEPILHLRNYNCFDYTKLDQTSCVYCYGAPVVAQRIESSSSSCTQKKRLVAEDRQHSFRPNQLVYNDASTGLIMANTSEMFAPKACPRKSSNDGPSTSSMNVDSENMVSAESSDNSINDVWIHDYARCPSSSDYAPQSNGLMIDENENDLFSL